MNNDALGATAMDSSATTARPRRHRRRILIGGAVAATAALIAGGAFALTGGGYDESEHRAAIEAVTDRPLEEWDEYLRYAKRDCEWSAAGLSGVVGVARTFATGDGVPEMRVNYQYLCPERLDELEAAIDAEQFDRAMGRTTDWSR